MINSNATNEPNKDITIAENISTFYSNSAGNFNIKISKGSYTISIIDGKKGEDGELTPNCGSPEMGQSGEDSSITYQNQKYTSGNTSMNIINDSSILLVIGQGGKGGAASLGYECRPGSDGADGSISIRPIL